jgi:hypothetical protein
MNQEKMDDYLHAIIIMLGELKKEGVEIDFEKLEKDE